MNGLVLPTFNKSAVYDKSVFETSIMQVYVALFISKPELYASVHKLPSYAKQEEFFKLFRKFVLKYYTFDVRDERDIEWMVYFGSLQVDKAGCANICGGSGGSRSNSGKKGMLDNYKSGQEMTKKMIVYLSDKYKVLADDREFIGHKQIWMDPSPALLEKAGMEWVANEGYDDETFATEFPVKLDKSLVPLAIRNKVVQKWKKWKSDKTAAEMAAAAKPSREEEEEEAESNGKVHDYRVAEETKEVVSGVVIDDELQKMLEEEDW